jgi:hypothetical protein
MAEHFNNGKVPFEIGGQSFLLSYMSDEVVVTLGNWVKQQFAAQNNSLAKILPILAKMPPETHAAVLASATQEQLRTEPTPQERSTILQTVPAASYLLWLLAAPNHPGLSLPACQAVVNDTNWPTVWEAAQKCSGLQVSQ